MGRVQTPKPCAHSKGLSLTVHKGKSGNDLFNSFDSLTLYTELIKNLINSTSEMFQHPDLLLSNPVVIALVLDYHQLEPTATKRYPYFYFSLHSNPSSTLPYFPKTKTKTSGHAIMASVGSPSLKHEIQTPQL